MYQKVFKAGKYGDFEITADMLREVADSYDTTYKKSPVNIDHWGGESYGWIEAVQLNGEYLEAEIEFTDDAKALLATGKYKYPSIELADYDGKPYLRAIALTNYNRVRNLPELQFSESNIRRFADASCELTFDKFNEISNQNSNMKKLIKQLSAAVSMDYTDNTTDEAVLEKCVEHIEGLSVKLKAFEKEGVTIDKFKELKASVDSFADKRAEDLVSSAIVSNKITVAQKDKYLKLAKADYDSVSELFAEMKQGNAFAKNFIKSKAALETESSDDSEVKYGDIIKNPELQANYSEAELEDLRSEYMK